MILKILMKIPLFFIDSVGVMINVVIGHSYEVNDSEFIAMTILNSKQKA